MRGFAIRKMQRNGSAVKMLIIVITRCLILLTLLSALSFRKHKTFIDAFVLYNLESYNTRLCNCNIYKSAIKTLAKKSSDEETESNEDDVDWRAFRAQLVQSEADGKSISDTNTDKSARWAYDSGDFVEPGSIVISIPSSNRVADDIDALNNQCYRKSIVMVLNVKPDFIQGIILNRPTNIRVVDGMKFVRSASEDIGNNEEDLCSKSSVSQWKIWFGGEAFGPYSDSPEIVCLHSIQTNLAFNVSKTILGGILMTSFEGAQVLVKAGDARPSDFWLFCGISGWETTKFYKEMHEERLWTVLSSDGSTILEELNLQRCEEEELGDDEECGVDSDSRNAGIHTWEMLMDMIGRGTEARQSHDSFGDLMLREWASGALSFSFDEEKKSSHLISGWSAVADSQNGVEDQECSEFDVTQYDPATSMTSSRIVNLQQRLKSQNNGVGTLIRASASGRSPFLLSEQGYHKSLILIIRDDDECSEGVILNHVTDSVYSFDLGEGETSEVTIRYGGPVQENEQGQMLPLTILHSSKQLAEAGIGSLVVNGLFRCTEEEIITAIRLGLTEPDDLMVIYGLSVWRKIQRSDEAIGGFLGDIEEGFFEPVSQTRLIRVWDILMKQGRLSHAQFDKNMALLQKAWCQAGNNVSERCDQNRISVFGSDRDVVSLADEALCRWLNVYFLGGTS